MSQPPDARRSLGGGYAFPHRALGGGEGRPDNPLDPPVILLTACKTAPKTTSAAFRPRGTGLTDDLIYSIFREIAVAEGKRSIYGTWSAESAPADMQRLPTRAYGAVYRASVLAGGKDGLDTRSVAE
jgi:hypothetical protein